VAESRGGEHGLVPEEGGLSWSKLVRSLVVVDVDGGWMGPTVHFLSYMSTG
jgi:hypothetical protein